MSITGSVESREISHFCPRKRTFTSPGKDGGSGSSQRFVRIWPWKPLLRHYGFLPERRTPKTRYRKRCLRRLHLAPISGTCRFPDLGALIVINAALQHICKTRTQPTPEEHLQSLEQSEMLEDALHKCRSNCARRSSSVNLRIIR